MKYFIQVAIAVLLMPIAMSSVLAEPTNPKVSVQLWSVKEDVKASIDATLETIAAMDFDAVEFAQEFGRYQDNAPALVKKLNVLGLAVSGAHVSFESLDAKNFDRTVAFYQALGCKNLIVGWDERAWHPEGVVWVANELSRLAPLLEKKGMRIGFHNHDHEFNAFNGTTFWDYIATHTPESVILQQDVGWTTYAGQDPVAYVERYPGRTLTTHYKVKLPEGAQGKLPIIGKDTIDWLKLIAANKTVGGTEWLVVEQEEYPNGMSPLEAVQASKLGLDSYLAAQKK
ncbi:sugar phosphate isomerase/epimerase [Simiduia curdlanivorans]|uniref:Sugar phosphate isomerase/epimerase family protein n=1 Tax=Simiduia curdlanivorans TaxID=1492769 RepID=A0ABV8V0Y2_9GAMM|nr:sugar phosphate isomerase/epimerase [Simiduia curdlanivorans]MDN3637807.1 sugar phosphate isomerase/epimerase [Simiduia curdlanivorans]